jgi:hypothetical protein
VKIDRRLSARQHLFGRFSLEDWTDKRPNAFGNIASPDLSSTDGKNRSVTLDDSYSLGSWILHGNYGYGFSGSVTPPAAPGFDPTSLGFPSSMKSGLEVANFRPSRYPGTQVWVRVETLSQTRNLRARPFRATPSTWPAGTPSSSAERGG